ncbi:MAG TPA: hypothetical protein VGI20_13930 [Rhizomicrobium sp.]|jgi:hypothetical protein
MWWRNPSVALPSGERDGRGALANGVPDGLKNAFEILVDLPIPESQYDEASIVQVRLAALVVTNLGIAAIRDAVEFYDESHCRTGEIRDERSYRVLSPKTLASDRAAPKA